MYPRYAKHKVTAALQDTPVVIIAGPRQCGKTTLAKEICQTNWQYLTLDDPTQLDFAKHDPVGFIRHLSARHVIIDEVQRAPELFIAIKQAVDENRQPGRFLLTGSANALLLPSLAEALTGRLEIITLLPLATVEIQQCSATFLPKILAGEVPTSQQTRIRETLIEKIIAGGFPEPLARNDPARRTAWHLQYINTLIQKDVTEMGKLEHLHVMPKLVQLLAQQVGQLTNHTELAGRIGLSRQTMLRYATLLEQLYVFESLPAWHRNEHKRLIKTPKIHIVDSGLLCALKRITAAKLQLTPQHLGTLVESYVICELKRLASWLDEPLYFYHYRDKDKTEVDLVLETLTGEVFGIEIKATATLKNQDFRGLERLQKLAGDGFVKGLLLYDGDHATAFNEQIYAIPLGAIWN